MEIEGIITPETELDLSGAGFSVPRCNWQIKSVEVESPDTGKQRALVTFANEDGDEVTMREWLQHPTQQAQDIGQGNLKRLLKAATGSPTGSLGSLQGEWVSAEGVEDDMGFRRLRAIKPATVSTADSAEGF